MEGPNKSDSIETLKRTVEAMSGKEKLEAILPLFGTDEAREAFIENCREYIDVRTKAVGESLSASASVRSHAVTSSPKQAKIHNKIMDALTRLASQSTEISPLQKRILADMYDRNVTAAIIKEYVMSTSRIKPEEDPEELEDRKSKMSETAYYHALGDQGWERR